MSTPQNFKNHTRWDPVFHFFIAPILLANIAAVGVWYSHHRYTHVHSGPWAVLVAVVLLLVAMKSRMYALKVQDRVIRMEEKQRLAMLASPSELAEFDSITVRQYVALRFASNPEVVELARRAVREKLEPKQIKESIKSWRADDYRV